ncbi:retrovirus-related pol polyprotein from transposon TNT 1-94 [Tanacetum coccineum]
MFDRSLNPPTNVDLQAPNSLPSIPEVLHLEHDYHWQHLPQLQLIQDAPSPSTLIQHQKLKLLYISHDVEEDLFHTIVLRSPVFNHKANGQEDHPLENIIGALDRPVSTRLQLHEQALFCYYDAFLTSVEPKNYKDALTQACWIEAMQEELHEFERLEVWELVPPPDKAFVISLNGSISHLSNGCEDCVSNGNLRDEVYVSQRRIWLPTLIIRREGNELLLVQIYVDDIIFAASTPELSVPSGYSHGVETKLMRKNEWKAVDPITLSWLGYQKALNAVKKDLSRISKEPTSGLWCSLTLKTVMDPSDAMQQPSHSHSGLSTDSLFHGSRRYMHSIDFLTPKHQSESSHNDDEILLSQLSNKLMVDPYGFEGYLKMVLKYMFQDFRYSDTARLSRSVEVLKFKNFKKDETLKLSKSSNQELYEHAGPEVTSPQDGKIQDGEEIMLG